MSQLAKANFLGLVGNMLIILAIGLTTFIYLPIIKLELNYRTQTPDNSPPVVVADFRINIPKLKIDQLVVPQVDPFDRDEYQEALKRGVAHASGSALPDEAGNVYLFAHSSDNPLSITRYNTEFYLLPKLEAEDLIYLTYQNKVYTYQVVDQQIVSPTNVSQLLQGNESRLTLQTCYPVGTDWRRLLIIATPKLN